MFSLPKAQLADMSIKTNIVFEASPVNHIHLSSKVTWK